MKFFKDKGILFIVLLAAAGVASYLLLVRQALNFKSAGSGLVQIVNDTGSMIDSVQVRINNYQVATGPLQPGHTGNYTFKRRGVNSKHDIVYFIKGFKNGQIAFGQHFFSNDLGHIPDSFKVRITPALKLEQF
jgi:hypothetical protein